MPFGKWAVWFCLCRMPALCQRLYGAYLWFLLSFFLLWMWHLVVLNLICSIWDYPLGHCTYRSSHCLLLIFSYMTLFPPFVHLLPFNLSAHWAVTWNTHWFLIAYLESFLNWTKLEINSIMNSLDITYPYQSKQIIYI